MKRNSGTPEVMPTSAGAVTSFPFPKLSDSSFITGNAYGILLIISAHRLIIMSVGKRRNCLRHCCVRACVRARLI